MLPSSLRFALLALALPACACVVSVACSSTHETGSTGAGGAQGTGDAGTGGALGPAGPVARHSSSIAVSPDGKTVYVVNADTDSVSQIDTTTHALVREIPLAASPPAVAANCNYTTPASPPAANCRYTPAVQPRALALSPRAGMLYVTGERSGKLHGIDLATGKVTVNVAVGSEPIGVLVAPDESAVFVACSNEGTVVRVDPVKGAVTATATINEGMSPAGAPIPAKPWALGWSLDGKTLYASHLLSPSISSLDPGTLASNASLSIPDLPRDSQSPLIANGKARGLYDVVARPGGSGEIWVPHMMLATNTAQTAPPSVLNFQTTAFPTISVLNADGTYVTRMSTTATGLPGATGAFIDIVSGPHALEITADGRWALMLDSASEDILAVDADARLEQQLLSPLHQPGGAPGHMLEGIVLSPDGKLAYVDERNVGLQGGPGDVAVIDVDTSSGTLVLSVDASSPLPRFAGPDPMPAPMRHGQFVFNTSNSNSSQEMLPISDNNWIACATCHLEGRSDAVTWQFEQGPRDTPSNAGGLLDTGFLFRTADRRVVTDYWRTIDDEQGGSFSTTGADGGAAPPTAPSLVSALADLQTYVNFAIPAPVPPTHTDATLVLEGEKLFFGTAGCTTCHTGPPAYTDSGQGNASLDLTGPIVSSVQDGGVLLHDVGTCATTGFPDVVHDDEYGDPRDPCAMGFDTPTLRGISDSAPYLHDGSAPTLLDVLVNTKGKMGNTGTLSLDQLKAIAEYLRTL